MICVVHWQWLNTVLCVTGQLDLQHVSKSAYSWLPWLRNAPPSFPTLLFHQARPLARASAAVPIFAHMTVPQSDAVEKKEASR